MNSDIVAMMVRQGSPEFTEGPALGSTEGLTMILRLAQERIKNCRYVGLHKQSVAGGCCCQQKQSLMLAYEPRVVRSPDSVSLHPGYSLR